MVPSIRPLREPDIAALLSLIQALADYEHLPGPDADARDRLTRDAMAEPPGFRVLLAETEGRVIGYAVYMLTYSTFLARPTLYVEDIFVLPKERRNGAGRALMQELAREAARRDCGRMEWHVLDWNTPAQDFYRSLGAGQLDEWRLVRLTGAELGRLAGTLS
jgi:GNAT superfamily N-acetyltransferase